jgi:DNA helicase II / ATP-dependent DNA helicase PcrA
MAGPMSDPFDLDDIPFDDSAPAARPGGIAARAMAAAAPAEPPYLKTLNESQTEAVVTTDGPVLVLAGAGTGKTRVLVTRIAHILNLGLAKPWEILSVTFTNRAAREMSDRVGDLVGGAVDGIWLGTFHSIGVRILRQHAELVGLKNNFTIIDRDDQLRVLKQLLKAENIDEKRWPARALGGIIDRWKDRGLTWQQVQHEDAGEFAMGKTTALYREYQQRLLTQNAADFGDLLLHCLTLFTQHKDILDIYHRRFRYILVDEYQDTNVAQYLWLRLLAQGQKNICCVGDDDQSIYGWRGAEIGNILRYEEDFAGAKVIRLERNYRSTPHILAAASALIAHNEGRLGKTLWTDMTEGEKVRVRGFWDGEEEARAIAEDVEDLQRKGHQLDEISILVRAGYQTREFEDRFLTIGVPYRVIGGPRFYERREIRDAIAYLRVISQPEDGMAFERIVNVPKRGLGEVTVQAMHKVARAGQIALLQASQELLGTDELRAQARTSLGNLLESFARWRAMKDQLPLPELVETVLDESGYTEMWQRDKSIDAPGRLDNLRELVHSVGEYESLTDFLDHVSLVMDHDTGPDEDMVNIMTLHAAKGLEFDTVFLPGWEEGLFPNQRSLDEGGTSALEEERRLAHVGMTRARKMLRISFAQSRRTFAEWQSAIPSRFIDELPIESVEVAAEASVWGQAYSRDDDETHGEPVEKPWDSPGRRRMRRRNNRGVTRDGQLIEARAELVDFDERPTGSFSEGDRVFHQKFGYGQIESIDGNRLEIQFDKAGSKKVIDSFVRPA